eukprot:Nitzschia sp. Nitz4//scaffold26_size159584//126431//127174//NITZ4_002512-RA/size159584-processed-gene-0.53-mRNA-1//1//CDS//3329545145//4926//frame0
MQLVSPDNALEALADALVLNNQATQEMLSSRHDTATGVLLQALQKIRGLVSLSQHAEDGEVEMTGKGSLDIALDWKKGTTTHINDPGVSHSCVFHHPVELYPIAQGSAHGTTFGEISQKVSFGIIVNLAICHHVLAMKASRNNIYAKAGYTRAIQLYRHAGELLLTCTQRSHLELILLNNLGEAYQYLHQKKQASICYQCLVCAAEDFKETHRDVYSNSTEVRSLVDTLLDHTILLLTESANGAPAA